MTYDLKAVENILGIQEWIGKRLMYQAAMHARTLGHNTVLASDVGAVLDSVLDDYRLPDKLAHDLDRPAQEPKP